MNVETKYSVGQFVWLISSRNTSRIVKCIACHNTGKVVLVGEELICPKCNGSAAHPQYAGHKWYVDQNGTIGQVTYKISDPKFLYADRDAVEVTYMVDSTGVGSGTVWKESALFLSREEAEEECNRRNQGTKWEDESKMLASPMKY